MHLIFLTLATLPVVEVCVYMEKVYIAGEPEPSEKIKAYVLNCTTGTMAFNFTGLN